MCLHIVWLAGVLLALDVSDTSAQRYYARINMRSVILLFVAFAAYSSCFFWMPQSIQEPDCENVGFFLALCVGMRGIFLSSS